MFGGWVRGKGRFVLTELQEAKLVARAVNKRWGTTHEERREILDEVVRIVRNGKDEKVRLAAAQAYQAAEAQNQQDEHKFLDAVGNGNRFLGIAKRLGIDCDSGDAATSGPEADLDGVVVGNHREDNGA